MVSAEKNSAHRFWSRVVAVAVVFFPYSLHHVDFRSNISFGLSVSANHSSPAYAALEDSRESYKSESAELPSKTSRLMAGQQRYQLPPLAITKIARVRHIVMHGLTVQSRALDPQPFFVAGLNTVHSPRLRPEPQLDPNNNIVDHSGDLLPLAQRKELLAAALKAEDISQPTPALLAQKLVADARRAEKQRTLQSSTGTPIFIAKGDGGSEISQDTLRDAQPADDSSYGFTSSMATVEPNPDQLRPLWLSGHIEMTGGLAFVGSQTSINVRQVLDGRTIERGRVWVTEGRFEIHVSQALGSLVAELVTRDGHILGRGEMSLLQLQDIPARNNAIGDIRLALQPTTEGASMRAISGYSHGQQLMPVKEARIEIQSYTTPQKVNDEGVVAEASLTSDSSFVARATARKHWPSLLVAQASQPQDIRLFSNSLVEALAGIEFNGRDRKDALEMALVWGQVTERSQPKAGAQVEMAGDYQPIYFNEMYLPDPRLKATSKNGMFAFLRVRRGVQALRVKNQGKIYPAQIFPTENKHVSYVAVDISHKAVSQFHILDVFDAQKQVSARVRLVGAENATDINGRNYVEYDMAANPFMVEAEAGPEYEISRVTLTGHPQLVNIPMIRRDWLHDVLSSRRIFELSGRGTIVGFVDSQDFDVEITGYGPQEVPQILYFDRAGKILNARQGVAGGGFIIVNAPLGLQTVYIHPTQSRESYAEVVVAEPEYVHVIAWAPSTSR